MNEGEHTAWQNGVVPMTDGHISDTYDNGDGRGYNHWHDKDGEHWNWFCQGPKGPYNRLFDSTAELQFSDPQVINNPDGSSLVINTVTGTNKNGVTISITSVDSYDSEGNFIGQTRSITFTKGNSGSLTIDVQTNSNYTYVRYEIKDSDGNTKALGVVNGVTLIGLRDWGTGKQTTKGDRYNDMIIIASQKGRIAALNSCNFRPTKAKGYTDKNGKYHELTPDKYNSIADGSYEFYYGYHGTYPAFWVNDNGDVSGFRNGKKVTMTGVHIHRGGDDWSWSTGCITIYDPNGKGQWATLMSFFNSNPAKTDSDGNTMVDPFTHNVVGQRDEQWAGNLVIF